MIVSFSGIDSAGKTTQINLLENYCKINKIRMTRLWGKARGTPGVLLIKEILRKDKKMSQNEKLEYRQEVFQNSKKKKLLLIASLFDLCWYFGIYYRIRAFFCRITVLDRYIWDTFIEVKTEFTGVDFEQWLLWRFVLFVSPKPEVSFIFLIPPDESIRRDLQKKDLTVDSIELKKEKIAQYLKLTGEKKWTHMMDGMQPVDELHRTIVSILNLM